MLSFAMVIARTLARRKRSAFVARIHGKQNEIEKIGAVEWYRFVLSMYSGLRDVIASGMLGGAIVHATAV